MRRSSSKGSALRFTHLRLENWRNFTKVDLDLKARAFLVGPNAAGKSNLLDVFRFLHDIVSVGGGFREAVTARGGVSSIRALAARKNPEIVVEVRIGDEENDRHWTYRLQFKQDSADHSLIERETVYRSDQKLLDRPDKEDREDPQRLTQTYLEQVHANKEFREVSEFFQTVHYLHIVPQLIREPDRSVGRSNDPYGGDFLQQMAAENEKTPNAWLRRVRNALRVAVPQLQEIEIKWDSRGSPHLRGKYEHWRPQGAWQTEERLSDGTLRLLGLLWITLGEKGPLLLEEPELSLHPEVVRYIPQMFAKMQSRTRRQVLLSTHAAEMLEDEGIGLDEVVLLRPGKEGTSVTPASAIEQIRAVMEGGVPLSEPVKTYTKPSESHQLALFWGD